MQRVKAMLVGVGYSPKVVAAVRGFLLYAIPIGVPILVAYLSGLRDPKWLGLPLALVPVVRAVGEAALDQLSKPLQNSPNPPPVAGSGGGDPSR
jgi:hypothetical protein